MDERIDELTRKPTVIVSSRQKRPNLPSGQCPFCPGGLEAPEPYDVKWFENHYHVFVVEWCGGRWPDTRIMDTVFAMETANLSRAQILQQAGNAMVAQANQLPQQVLQLLQR